VTEAVARAALPSLRFAVCDVTALEHVAVPTLLFRVRIESEGFELRSLSLNVQLRIAPARRRYSERDQARLVELFGPPERWAEALRTFRWAQVSVHVPAFDEQTAVELAVPCTYDLEVATAKYFYGLDEGDVPLEFLFSGTIFFPGDGSSLQTAQIPWDCEASYAMPVRVWKDAMELHFPGSAWLRVRDDVFDRLAAYKAQRALPTWDATLDDLLKEHE
jgi:hypothetical protein